MAETANTGAKEGGSTTSSASGQQGSLRTTPASNIQTPSHRLSFTENLRNGPASPRQRNPSLTQAAVQELMNNPPSNKHANPKFVGRDWQDVSVGELVSHDDVRWASLDTSVEEATSTLLKSPTSVVLIRDSEAESTAVSVFDFSDLNTYLLTVVGLATPDSQHLAASKSIMDKAQSGKQVLLREIQPLCNSGPLITLDSECKLGQAVELLGSGIHRLLVTGKSGEAIGVMSQLRVLDFFWNEGVNFANIDSLYPMALRELATGTQHPISINSDEPLRKALGIMNEEGLSSIAVVDNGRNVVGNISVKDVRHLTTTSSAPLLNDNCMHFISVILNERGVEKGRDAFPVFYVNPLSTLAHTVAKLVATRSHRMWVVESVSPTSSIPPTPSFGPSGSTASVHDLSHSVAAGSVPASALAGARLSGKLTGVVSLTDILNIFAKSTGLRPSDPGEQRARRRRSSSSSMRPADALGRSIR